MNRISSHAMPAPLRMQLMALIGFLALVGAMVMLVSGSPLRTGFATSGSIGLQDEGQSDSPPGSVHLSVGRNASTNYDPNIFQHASIAGPDQTKLVLKEFVHQGNPIYSDVSVYWGGRWAHVNIEFGKSLYIDLHKRRHITSGTWATSHFLPEYHIATGPDATEFDKTEGGTKRHVTSGQDKTRYVVIGDHVASGASATAYDPTRGGTKQHISAGTENVSSYFSTDSHVKSGENATGLIPIGTTTQPTPPIPTPPTQ